MIEHYKPDRQLRALRHSAMLIEPDAGYFQAAENLGRYVIAGNAFVNIPEE